MMKKIFYCLLTLAICFLVGCVPPNNNTNNGSNNNTPDEEQKPNEDESLLEFSGIEFKDKSIPYDGEEHTIEVSGVPSFANVSYSNEGPYVNVGQYEITVKITADNYKDLTLKAKLNITEIEFSNVAFENGSFDYDGNPHSITISGNLPADATVEYSSDVAGVSNSAIEVGVYNITATIKAPNFKTLVLNAKLTINATDDERYLAVSEDTLFFQNAIDEDKLYAYNFSNSMLKKVSNDKAVDIEEYDSNSVLFVSKTLLASSIKQATYDEVTNITRYLTILNESARYIQIGDDATIYYVINGLTNNKSGIYKADLSGEEPVITCLSVGKAKYLKLYNSTLYFADGANDYKLSKINTTGSNQTRTLVLDEKVNNLTLHNGVLYFNIDNLLGDYIAKYTISTGVTRKLTQDAGINFVIVDNELYYINIDKFSSAVFGNGIYKVNINPLADNNLPGIKVIDGGDMGVCSLSSYGDYLLYYEVDGYKLIKYSIKAQTKVNLLEGFTKPEDPTPTSFGSQVVGNNGTIYYLDIYDGKTLHSYNPKTKTNIRLTSEKVDNFAIIGDYIYFNMVTYGVNNDTYRMNYKNGGIPELVNSFDSTDLVSDGNYIYYVERNAAGASTAIHKAKMDGSEDVIIFEYAADNLVLYNGTLYFSAKPTAVQTIMKIENVASVSTPQPKVCVNDDYASDVFTIADGVIYFRQNYGLAYKFHRLAKMNIDGTGYTELVTTDTDPTEIIVSNGYVFYTNSADTSNDYNLYKISTNGTDGTQVKLTNKMYVSTICVVENKVYYINYYLGGALGDSHLYSVSTNGGESIKIA